jgi:transcription initiation factor IIE alpha subunit
VTSEVRAKVLKVLETIPQGVLYSTTDWNRILNEDKREIRKTLEALEEEGEIEVVRSEEGRPDKPLYKLKDA